PARLIDAVSNGDIDVAAAWGPLGGYFAQRSNPPLEVRPITDTAMFAPLPFEFSIAMGVRRGDEALRDEIDAVLERQREAVRAVLLRFGVPLVDGDQGIPPESGRASAESAPAEGDLPHTTRGH